MQAVRCYVERPRTNGTSTSGRSRVRYAPCPVNSSTGYTQPVDAGKGDLLYPVPDPTPRPGGGGGHSHTVACLAPMAMRLLELNNNSFALPSLTVSLL